MDGQCRGLWVVICKETKYYSIPLNDINLNIKIYNIENH